MHDLCTRPDPPEPPQNGSSTSDTGLVMSNGEPESPAGPGHPDRENPPERLQVGNVTNLGSYTTNGNDSMTVPAMLLGKRHHSLYEGLNGCEARDLGKVRLRVSLYFTAFFFLLKIDRL